MTAFQSLGLSPQQLEIAPLAFGEWLPDMPYVNNPGGLEALNVIPSEECYVPFKELVLTTGATLAKACNGAIEVFGQDGSPYLYAASVDGIFKRVSASMVSLYTPTITLYDKYNWQFIQFGSSLVALHPQQSPVVADVGGSLSFSPLAGSPPIAYCGARVGNFLVLGNLDNEADPAGTRWPSRIRWSGFDNITSPWTTNPATQADFNDMPNESGAVMAITGREYGTIFQERGISRMTYAGLPTVFDIETVEESRGAISTGAVVDIGIFVFFIAEDGFHVWNGTNTTPLGDNKVNRYFFNQLNYTSRSKIVSAVDYFNKCVVWAYPTGSSTTPTELIIYSYKENRFSRSDKAMEWLISGYTFDTSIDELTGNIDTGYPVSFDSDIYLGRRPYLAGFDNAHAFGFFNGANRAAVLDTAEYSGVGGNRSFVNCSRPVIDLDSPVATVQIAARDQLRGEALVFGTATAQEITGEVPILGDARYMRFRTAIPAGSNWSRAQGLEIWRKTTGRR
ncbi:MAG: hypothetical protein E6Q97_30590 [Desulfurellales bacterium]|nr:MAG: hypothetical protein E6Q97_30590 [Desulfurellales bacterium]